MFHTLVQTVTGSTSCSPLKFRRLVFDSGDTLSELQLVQGSSGTKVTIYGHSAESSLGFVITEFDPSDSGDTNYSYYEVTTAIGLPSVVGT